MNRSELVDRVASATGIDRRKAEDVLKTIVNTVVSEVKAGNKVSIFQFGTFTPRHQEGRMGRNPRTNQAVKIGPRNAVKFSAATAFKEALNARGTKKSAAKKATTSKAAGTTRATKATKSTKAAGTTRATTAAKATKSTKSTAKTAKKATPARAATATKTARAAKSTARTSRATKR